MNLTCKKYYYCNFVSYYFICPLLFSAELHAHTGIKELNQLGGFTNMKRHMEVAHGFTHDDQQTFSPFITRFSEQMQIFRFNADIRYV